MVDVFQMRFLHLREPKVLVLLSSQLRNYPFFSFAPLRLTVAVSEYCSDRSSFMIITISGDIGSGKSTTGKLLQERLDYLYLSTGAIQREIAASMGLTTLELNKLTESRLDIDEKIDGYTRALNDAKDDYIVDSRLAWHFIPSSYKVFLRCEEEIAAQRISKDDKRKSDEENRDLNHLLKQIQARRKSEAERFKRIYDINFEDLLNYDQVIDSSYFTPDEIVNMIVDGRRMYLNLDES